MNFQQNPCSNNVYFIRLFTRIHYKIAYHRLGTPAHANYTTLLESGASYGYQITEDKELTPG